MSKQNLREQIEAQALWIKEGKKLNDSQNEEILRLRKHIGQIFQIATDPAFNSDAMGWIANECRYAINPNWIDEEISRSI